MADASYTDRIPKTILPAAEIWRPAPGFETYLEVSNLGSVRTLDYLAPSRRALQPTQLRRGQMLKPDAHGGSGYPRVAIRRHSRKRRLYVHRLVALAFVPGHFPGATVDHLDGQRSNNVATNLAWVTRRENTVRQNRDGRGVPKGEFHPSARLADSDIPHIFGLREAGWSLAEISRQFDVSPTLIQKITTGQRRAHQAPPP